MSSIYFNIVVLISGNGSTLQYLIDNLHNTEQDIGMLSDKVTVKIVNVISNKRDAFGLIRAEKANIPTTIIPYIKGTSRVDYDDKLAHKLKDISYQLIVCAGWMRILSSKFLDNHKNIINLHPALPGQFPGAHAKEDAYKAFLDGKIKETGCMVHWVIPEIDAGKTIMTSKVKLFHNMSFLDIKNKIEYKEKLCILNSIKKVINEQGSNLLKFKMATLTNNIGEIPTHYSDVKCGKVRDIYEIETKLSLDRDYLLFLHSDRCSAFDYNICDIDGKGNVLCETASWWFNKTRSIMPNHYVSHRENMMLVEKCRPIMVEVIVRGYITGSLWSAYSKGERMFCGVTIPDGLRNNQKLSNIIVTPTTKDEHDEPITPTEIINRGLATVEQWNTMTNKALELFRYGQKVVDEVGLILVDTKYEFGIDRNGNVMLIDEIHTADSSRYWLKDTYQERYDKGESPQKWDKDAVRDYLKTQGFPSTTQDVPEVPEEVKTNLANSYYQLYQRLTGDELKRVSFQKYKLEFLFLTKQFVNERIYTNRDTPRLYLLAGSVSDTPHVEKFNKFASDAGIILEWKFASAHKQTFEVMDTIARVEENYTNVIWITVAGRSNALSGVVASNTRFPVIACPPFKDKMDMMVNINSTLQMPSKVPVMTILEPSNVILACQKIFNLGN